MEADMPCPRCGHDYVPVADNRVCPKCGHVAGYKQIDIVKVLSEHKRFYDKLSEIRQILNGEGSPGHKIAEIQLIVEDD